MLQGNRQRFREQLKRNVGFIRRSCEMYDQGHTDEAMRIATALRILMHDTSHSVSLLKHLRVKSIMKFSSSCQPPPQNVIAFQGLGQLYMNVSKDYEVTRRLRPVTDKDAPRPVVVPWQQWWEMPIYVSRADAGIRIAGSPDRNIFITRKNLILGAANKDGGAHVDAELDPDYEFLASIGALQLYSDEVHLANGETVSLPPLKDAHLVYLRQIGYEVLESLDLRMLLAIK